MNRLERWGAELALLIVRRKALEQEWDYIQGKIAGVEAELLAASEQALLAHTDSYPSVGDERPTQVQNWGQECPGQDICPAYYMKHFHVAGKVLMPDGSQGWMPPSS